MKLFLAVPINIYDPRMNGFSTETAVCLQTLHYSVLIGAAHAFYAQISHMITCSKVFAKSPAFLDSILVYCGQICRQVPPQKFLFGGRCILIALRAEKTYLVIQTWRIVK